MIIQGDSFQILEHYKDKSFDYCLTSPWFKEEDVKEPYWPWFDGLISLLKQKISKVAFIFQSSTKMKEMYARYSDDIHRVLIWGKEPSCYSYRFEPIFVFLFDKSFKVNKYIFKDFWRMPPILKNNKTYENPPKLYHEIIMLLPPGRIVDPFAGTGALGLACRGLKHEAILIDKKPIKLKRELKSFLCRETEVSDT